MDKQHSLVSGHASCLPSYDCDVPFPKPGLDRIRHELTLASTSIAYPQEDIYRNLYSTESSELASL